MDFYKFECIAWVRANTAEEALKDLHDEVEYSWEKDNHGISFQSYGVLVGKDEILE